MKKDILGTFQLNSLKLNRKFYSPGLMDGKCAATGTCDNSPVHPYAKKKLGNNANPSKRKSFLEAYDIRLKYGTLR